MCDHTEQKSGLRTTVSAPVAIGYDDPFGYLSTDFLLLRHAFVAFMGRVLHHAVIQWRPKFCHLLFVLPVALAEVLERPPELLRHEVVDDGVDSAVGVDAHPTEEQEPAVVVRRVEEGVDHHQRPVRHPEQGEEDDHDHQHLCYLSDRRRSNKCTLI